MSQILRNVRAIRDWGNSAGWSAAFAVATHRSKMALGFTEPPTLTIKPRQANYPVVVRLRGSSDLNVFYQIFCEEEYACLKDIASPRLILDLGANVGYSSAYFLSRFPSATVLAVEPDPGNFQRCRENLLPYGSRAILVQGGVWSKRLRLELVRGNSSDGGDWATQVRESPAASSDAAVEAWDIPSLLALVDGKQIDLLKVDIERSELEVFGNNYSTWLSNVANICIELHGNDCEQVFFNALKDVDYESGRSGELTLCRNLRPKANRSDSSI